MTKDGFMFMAMGFTGKEAAAIKEAFIDAQNKVKQLTLKLWNSERQRRASAASRR